MRFNLFLLLALTIGHTPTTSTAQVSGDIPTNDSLSLLKADTLTHPSDSLQSDDAVRNFEKDTLTIIGVGDIMMGSNYPDSSLLPPNQARGLMAEVSDILSKADITMGNLEGVLLNEGGTPKNCKNPNMCYVFRSPTSYVDNLVAAGFDVMGLANNHAGDFGDEGRASSMKTLEEAGIYHAGLLAQPYTLFEKEGVRYGFAAFAPNTGCASINDIQGAQATIAHLDSLTDVVIVSFHGGAEGSKYEHVPKAHEIFAGEDRGDVYHFAHRMIDAGADVIFGHGPHVTRAIEVYKDRFIAYSLGNFCTYGSFNLAGPNGLAPIIKVFTGKTGTFFKAHITPIYQTPQMPVRIDRQGRVISRIQTLTAEDFSETPLSISKDGWVKYSTR